MKPIILSFFCLLFASPAFPQGQVTVTKPGSGESSFDFTEFTTSGGAAAEFFSSFRKNLSLPAMFWEAPPSSADFRVLGSAIVSGTTVDVTVQVVDRTSNQRKYGKRYRIDAGQVSALARKISDEIYEDFTRRPGFTNQPILFVGQRPGEPGKDLYLVYPDGTGLRQLTRDRAVVLAPKWAPDAESITYTSFRGGFPDIYQQQLSPANGGKFPVLPA